MRCVHMHGIYVVCTLVRVRESGFQFTCAVGKAWRKCVCVCVSVCECLSAVRESPSIPGTLSPSPSPSLSPQVAEGGGQPCQKLIGSQ